MQETGRLQVEHLRRLAARMGDPEQAPTQRAAQAELLVQSAEDMRRALQVASSVVPGSRLIDAARVRACRGDVRSAAQERVEIREQIAALAVAELRAAPGFDRPVVVPDPTATGRGTFPLIREHGVPWDYDGAPVVPGVVGGDAVAAVNPDVPIADVPATLTIADVNADADRLDIAVTVASTSLQLVNWISPAGANLLDNALRDLVDLAAEAHVGAELEAAAGGTTAYADSGTLDAAEGAAGAAGNGPAELLIVNPADWPAVRRELGAAWVAGPHPEPVVTPGATAGTVTYCGPGAFWLLVADYIEDEIVRPRGMSVDTGIVRPFKLFVRNPAAIQTVTGIGA